MLSPEGERYEVSTFRTEKYHRVRCLLSTEMHVGHATSIHKRRRPHPLPFWFKRSATATFACCEITVFIADSNTFTIPIS